VELGVKKGSDWVPVSEILKAELQKVTQERIGALKEQIANQEDGLSSIRHFFLAVD